MKYALIAALVCTVGCAGAPESISSGTDGDGKDIVVYDPRSDFNAMVISDEEQAMIDEMLALIKEYYAQKEPDHFLILVGSKETLVDDMSCSSHDQDGIEQIFADGHPRFLHLAPNNKQYVDTPVNIKEAIDYVNKFSSNVGALADHVNGFRYAFNYLNEVSGRVNGKCQDLGIHHLGLLLKGDKMVTTMNGVGYGIATWNRLPVYAYYPVQWDTEWQYGPICAEARFSTYDGPCVGHGASGAASGWVREVMGCSWVETAKSTGGGWWENGDLLICDNDKVGPACVDGCEWRNQQLNWNGVCGC